MDQPASGSSPGLVVPPAAVCKVVRCDAVVSIPTGPEVEAKYNDKLTNG